jgi:hypothetical protein
VFRAHRGRSAAHLFRAHKARHVASIKVHARRGLRQHRVRGRRPRKLKAAKRARYHSLMKGVPSSYRRRGKPAPYRPVTRKVPSGYKVRKKAAAYKAVRPPRV